MKVYNYLADFVVVAHALYVSFVVFGLVAILAGICFRWQWVRNFWFRMIHLTMIAIVVFEALFGVVCPLTTLEHHWRRLAGETVQESSFMGRVAHDLLFYEAPQHVFTIAYCVFGTVVLATFILAPPQWRRQSRKETTLSASS